MDPTSYQTKVDIIILYFCKKEQSKLVFLNTTCETNINGKNSSYSYEKMLQINRLKL